MTGYPPDVLLDLLEGLIPLELALCFKLFVKKKYFTLSQLNSLKSFRIIGLTKLTALNLSHLIFVLADLSAETHMSIGHY